MNNNNKRYITVKPLKLDTFEKLIRRENGDKVVTNKVPAAVHFFEPAISQSSGKYLVDTDWINYELLGIKREKPDDRHISQLLMAKSAAEAQRRDVFNRELQKVNSEKYELQTKLDELSVKMANCDRNAADLDKQLDVELKKEKRSDTKINSIRDKKEKELESKQDYYSEWQLVKDLLASKEKREIELVNEERNPDNNIIQIEAEIIRARKNNVYTDKELQDQIAVRYTTNPNSNLDATVTSDSVWSKLERIKLTNDDIIFDRTDIKSVLQLCALMGAKIVAKSNKIHDTINGKYEYYIYDEDIEVKHSIASEKSKEEAYRIKGMLSQEIMRDILTISGISTYGMTEQKVEEEIYKLINADSEFFIRTARLQNTDRTQQRSVYDLISFGLIVNNDLGIGYKIQSTGQTLPVNNFTELVEYLHSTSNKDGLLKTLMNELDNKKSKLVNSHNFTR